jgi:aminopeptidase-like protein
MELQHIKRDGHERDKPTDLGLAMHDFMARLFPICRSITGNGVRETLAHVGKEIPLEIHEVPSGTQVFDWSVPLEWNITDAFIKDSDGKRLIDFQQCNLHVVNYSMPIHTRMTLADLKPHLHSLPNHPLRIPYRTSYYRENWGFCLSHKQLSELPEEVELEVCIQSTMAPGSLTFGECYLRGAIQEEILISCHVCHPSLCNDNLSGLAVATALAKAVADRPRRYSYRFIFIPATIGAITWMASNEAGLKNIRHGLVITGVGDRGATTYKKSRRGDAEVDRAMQHVLQHNEPGHRIINFFPYGYDERQYCSPAFNLPVGCLMRTPHGQYSEYHTSADNMDFVRPESLAGSYGHCLALFDILEHNETYLNQNPKCEPQLGRRGLYRDVAGQQESKAFEMSLLWVLNMSDGTHSLLDIAEQASMPFSAIHKAAVALETAGLLRKHRPVNDAVPSREVDGLIYRHGCDPPRS